MDFLEEKEERDGLKHMITNLDLSIMLFIQESLRTEVFNEIWKFITHLGDGGYLWIALGVILLFFKKTRPNGFTVLFALLINLFITNIALKNLIARPRPFQVSDAIIPLIERPASFSFPSGHTSGSFSAMLALYKWVPKKIGIPAVVLAALVGFSRIYIGVHYPTDVLGGILVGVISSVAAYYLVQYLRKKIREKKANG